ncbi:hypothetical protein TWF481_007562 [Arthrobotrys musiformis]|uniref:non-specific serine/threonine protein kinase n=1 Tax=Arthrobotrys musiformis TaxID=47236 RepID=A0AAV9WCU9_9PEZI
MAALGSNTSPPPTPPPEMPASLAEWRFEYIPRFECIEAYRPGGYHPVHFDDIFHNRYKVITKLGYGQYSTVWLARDIRSSEFVALKIKTAEDSIEDREIAILNYLNTSEVSKLGSEYVVHLKDSFYHQGPNGNHLCLVFEFLSEDIYSVLEDYSQETTGSDNLTKFPKPVAKRILRDILIGLNYLHQNGVVHGDLHPGNLLSSVKRQSLDSLRLEDLEAGRQRSTVEVKRRDGKLDKWAPKYLAAPPFLMEIDQWPVFPIKISDLGAGVLTSELLTDKPPVMPVGLRSPELILNSPPLDTYIDIWSFGCLMFEMLVGRKLFLMMPPMPGSNIDNCNDEHLLKMHEILGPLPEDIHAKWPRSGKYFRLAAGSREHYNSMVDGPECILDPPPSMEAKVRGAVSEGDGGLSEEDVEVILPLLREILNYDPLKRPSASEILKNSFWDVDEDAAA